MEKIRILADSPDPNDETAHLRPIIEFLKEQGNEPIETDEFIASKGGYSEFRFKNPIDRDSISNEFELPESIYFDRDGNIFDKRNGLIISR